MPVVFKALSMGLQYIHTYCEIGTTHRLRCYRPAKLCAKFPYASCPFRLVSRDVRDRLYYLKRVEHYRNRYGFIVYAYVLMSIHVHLLVETVLERAPHAEIQPGRGRLRFEKLLQAIAKVYGRRAEDLTAAGRHRVLTKSRAQLAYLSRVWCSMKATDIARRLNRDASMVSRLCATYEADRDFMTEKKIAEVIDK